MRCLCAKKTGDICTCIVCMRTEVGPAMKCGNGGVTSALAPMDVTSFNTKRRPSEA